MIDAYTRVLEVVAETGDPAVADQAVSKLVAHLKSAGRMGVLNQILRELRKIAARRIALQPRVEVARESDAAEALKSAAEAGIVADRAEVNTNLIRGWRAYGAGKLIDKSAKRDLIQIYKNVTE